MRFSLCCVLLFLSSNLSAQFLGQQSLSESSYVIDKDGNLWSWGRNFYGQLGVGDRNDRNRPVLVPMPQGASQWTLVAGGAAHAVAVADSDKLYAWGLNDKGQIGVGYAGNLFASPVLIPNPIGVKKWKWVSAGADHTEALADNGTLYAWGNNEQGQLGTGNLQVLRSPTPVIFPNGVTAWSAVAAGPGYTLMISQDDHLYGSGIDSVGRFQRWWAPMLASRSFFRGRGPLSTLAVSYRIESFINDDLADNLGFAPSTVSVAAGGSHELSLDQFGRINANGDNTFGQLGVGSGSIHTLLVPMPTNVSQFVAISAGLRHSLAIGNDGWLYAWGSDSLGELGLGIVPNQNHPVRVMKVGDSIQMIASIIAPFRFVGPYSYTLTVRNVRSATPLSNGSVWLTASRPLFIEDSALEQVISSPLIIGSSANVLWDGNAIPPIRDSSAPYYFAYIRMKGSAPLLTYGRMVVPQLNWKQSVEAEVVDSLTNKPLPDAKLAFVESVGSLWNGPPSDSILWTSDMNGVFHFNVIPVGDLYWGRVVSEYPCAVMKQNYQTFYSTITEPNNIESVDVLSPIQLSPAGILGNFKPVANTPLYTILKIYFPDSLTGYALSRRIIFRSTDGGDNWSAMYEASQDLFDLKFIDNLIGWVAADNGTLLSTTDGGENWQRTTVAAGAIRALSATDRDTVWAIADSGIVLKYSGKTWDVVRQLPDRNLTAIHFADPLHGVITASQAFYLYSGLNWIRHTDPILKGLSAACFPSIDLLFLGDVHGRIIDDSDPYGKSVLSLDSTYIDHRINSIAFLNSNVGFATTDTGAMITYDAGLSWPPIIDFKGSATSINLWRTNAYIAANGHIVRYIGAPNLMTGIVRGRLTYGDPPIPIHGAKILRSYVDSIGSDLFDWTYTNEQGNWAFVGLDSLDYKFELDFSDSGVQKSKVWSKVPVRAGKLITLDYNDYATPPPPEGVGTCIEQQQSLNISVGSNGRLAIDYQIPSDGNARLLIKDILGRIVCQLEEGYILAGSHKLIADCNKLPSGTYYIILEAADKVGVRAILIAR